MKRLPLLLATALFAAAAAANDQLRDVQGALKSQGFYYGEVTGNDSAETAAALRRFQIRNGVTVTGKLNADTLAALGFAEKRNAAPAPAAPQPAAQPAPAPAPEAPVQKQFNPPPPPQPAQPPQAMPRPGEQIPSVRRERALPPEPEAPAPTPPPARRLRPDGVNAVEPPTPVPAAVYSPNSTMFRDTPYATASREVQMNVIRRAQSLMAAKRLYRGPIDGLTAADTSEAIFLFQDEAELRRTGRLDTDTLAEMRLLPPPAPGSPLLKPFYNPNRHRDRTVSEN